MPKGFKTETTRKNETFARIARARMIENAIPRDRLMKLAGISPATMSHRFYSQKTSPEPDAMTVRELRVYCRALKLSDGEILDFVRG